MIQEAIAMMDRPATTRNPDRPDPAEILEVQFTACSVSFKPWWTNSRSLTKDERVAAAKVFHAESIRGGSIPLCPPDHPAVRALTTLRNEARDYWYSNSLDYPQDGLRLIRRAQLSEIRRKLDDFAAKVEPAAAAMDDGRDEFMGWCQAKYQDLFRASDYPATWRGLYAIGSTFPSVTPPNYLRELDPETYERERLRAMARLDEAVSMAEEAFATELGELVSDLVEKITSPGPNGRPKRFNDNRVDLLQDFFQRFRRLNVRSNAQLDALVDTARAALDGVSAQDLRDSAGLREATARRLGEVREALSGMMEEAPRRSLNRRKTADGQDT